MTSVTPFKVSPLGYFVYHNGSTKLEFDIQLMPGKDHADDAWIEGVLADIRSCLTSNKPIKLSIACESCNHRKAVRE